MTFDLTRVDWRRATLTSGQFTEKAPFDKGLQGRLIGVFARFETDAKPLQIVVFRPGVDAVKDLADQDRKSTRLNSSH